MRPTPSNRRQCSGTDVVKIENIHGWLQPSHSTVITIHTRENENIQIIFIITIP